MVAKEARLRFLQVGAPETRWMQGRGSHVGINFIACCDVVRSPFFVTLTEEDEQARHDALLANRELERLWFLLREHATPVPGDTVRAKAACRRAAPPLPCAPVS